MFTHFIELDKPALVMELALTEEDLIRAVDELAQAKIAEYRKRMEVWNEASSISSWTARETFAKAQTVPLQISVIEQEAELRKLEEQKWFIVRCLNASSVE